MQVDPCKANFDFGPACTGAFFFQAILRDARRVQCSSAGRDKLRGRETGAPFSFAGLSRGMVLEVVKSPKRGMPKGQNAPGHPPKLAPDGLGDPNSNLAESHTPPTGPEVSSGDMPMRQTLPPSFGGGGGAQ